MQFFLFLFSYALNPLIIYAVPTAQAEGFLTIYAVSSVVFSLLFTIAFAYQGLVDFTRYWVPLLSLMLIVAAAVTGADGLWVLYPFTLLVGDYICTQSGSNKISIIYRVLLILSAVPFIFFPEYFELLVWLRSAFGIAFVVVLMVLVKQFHVLAIKSPVKWIAVTYIFYSGSLLVVPTLGGGDGEHLKHWFIGMQVGLGLILKKLDFSVRAVSGKAGLLFKAIDVFVLLIPVVLMFISFDWLLLAVYVVSVIALYQLRLSPQYAKKLSRS